MKGNRRTDTKPEVTLRSHLHARGLRFRKDFRLAVDGRAVRPDVVFTKQQVAVFVDGCFWHVCPEHGRIPGGNNASYWEAKLHGNVERDKADTRVLEVSGWTVVRVWEHEELEEAADLIIGCLG